MAPVLWQLKASHYNEKARWALDYKGVAHVRRSLPPPSHQPIARKLTGTETFPVLVLDEEAIGDSTRIIAELERRHPEPPLYPSDPGEAERALALEDFFDEELGPYSRMLLMHHVLPDGGLFLEVFAPGHRGPRRALARATFPVVRRQVNATFGIDERSVADAFGKLRAAGERFRAELQPSGYLVGDRFTVADLTLAALLAPVLAPEQFPYPQAQRGHPRLAPVREALAESGLSDWALDIYARHRGSSAEVGEGREELAHGR
jgi:glutathione S-transferase